MRLLIGPMPSPYFHHASLIEAWALAARHLSTKNPKDFVWTVSCGTEWQPTPANLRILDIAAGRRSWERPSSVSEMILPAACDQLGLSAGEAIERGLQMLARARRKGAHFSGWKHTYFERMVGESIDKSGKQHHFRANKLISAIQKRNEWGRNTESALYIHIPLDDEGFRTRGGPCLQYVQFRTHGNNLLDVVGLYRAHDYGNKALGNLIGLDRLGRFVARHTETRLNGVTVVSLHPFVDHKTRLANFANDVAPR